MCVVVMHALIYFHSTATVGGGGSGAAIADIPLDDIEG